MGKKSSNQKTKIHENKIGTNQKLTTDFKKLKNKRPGDRELRNSGDLSKKINQLRDRIVKKNPVAGQGHSSSGKELFENEKKTAANKKTLDKYYETHDCQSDIELDEDHKNKLFEYEENTKSKIELSCDELEFYRKCLQKFDTFKKIDELGENKLKYFCHQIVKIAEIYQNSKEEYNIKKLNTPFGPVNVEFHGKNNFFINKREISKVNYNELILKILKNDQYKMYFKAICNYLLTEKTKEIKTAHDIENYEIKLCNDISQDEEANNAAAVLCGMAILSEPIRQKDGGSNQRAIYKSILKDLESLNTEDKK